MTRRLRKEENVRKLDLGTRIWKGIDDSKTLQPLGYVSG
jgi:hypothetical protein